MEPRAISTPLEYGWSLVYGRRRQLALLDSRLESAEQEARSRFEVEMARPNGEVPEEETHAREAVHQEFKLWAEASFLFAEAALNQLAEAVAETWQVQRDRSWDFDELRRQLEKRCLDPQTQELCGLREAMKVAHVRVVLPRHVMAVHSPAVVGNQGYSFLPDKRLRLESTRLWPPDSEPDDIALRQAVESVLQPPPDYEGRLLVMWALDHAEDLDDPAIRAVPLYSRKHGCSASPSDALKATEEVIDAVGAELGYPPEEWL